MSGRRNLSKCPFCGQSFEAPEWIEADVFLKWVNPYLVRSKYGGEKAYRWFLNGVHLGDRDVHGRALKALQSKKVKKIRRDTAEAMLLRVGLDPKVAILVKK